MDAGASCHPTVLVSASPWRTLSKSVRSGGLSGGLLREGCCCLLPRSMSIGMGPSLLAMVRAWREKERKKGMGRRVFIEQCDLCWVGEGRGVGGVYNSTVKILSNKGEKL